MDLHKQRNSLEEKFYGLAQDIVQDNELELYDMEYIGAQSLLRVFIIDPKTKTAELDDCVKVDRAFSEPCETLEWIPENLVLEVSSPGVYRNLKTKEHFEQAIGEIISCTLIDDLQQQSKEVPKSIWKSKKLRGELKAIKQDNILMDIDDIELEIRISNIKKAHLDPELKG